MKIMTSEEVKLYNAMKVPKPDLGQRKQRIFNMRLHKSLVKSQVEYNKLNEGKLNDERIRKDEDQSQS